MIDLDFTITFYTQMKIFCYCLDIKQFLQLYTLRTTRPKAEAPPERAEGDGITFSAIISIISIEVPTCKTEAPSHQTCSSITNSFY